MAIKIDITGDQCRVAIEGEMTAFSAQGLKEALLAPLTANGDIEMDLSAVSEIDSRRIADHGHAETGSFCL